MIPDKAKAYAYLLLKYRMRSEQELRQRLKIKKFSPTAIDELIEFLKVKKFLDDRAFAHSWLQSKLSQSVGLRRIEQQLKLKGISASIIRAELDALQGQYSEDDLIRGIVEKQFARLSNVDPKHAKRRIYAYCMRRGFSPDAVIDALNRYENT